MQNLYLVEGLNGAGKSTWISNFIYNTQTGVLNDTIVTSWMNPLRWPKDKAEKIETESYCIGSYETLFRSIKQLNSADNLFLDRTFISAYAYGTIGPEAFMHLYQLLFDLIPEKQVKVVLLAEPAHVCLDRIQKHKEKTNDSKYKSYADLRESAMIATLDKLIETVMEFPQYQIIKESACK